MRNLLAEYPAWFEPDEVQILLAAFDKAWEAVQASSIRYPADKLESVRAILAKRIIAAAMDGERDRAAVRLSIEEVVKVGHLRRWPESQRYRRRQPFDSTIYVATILPNRISLVGLSYFCVSSCLTSTARCGGMGGERASY